ncbi:hypothetical protein CK203_106899 [Vitis vinifera]|uniref:Uncharacterized protein n=1 Tax=Vitis vinifera TaxID=29760 RepID=A0A438C4L0_VITVI|nr:hypothetical protein CK203_106899 [Vitis vinifera]
MAALMYFEEKVHRKKLLRAMLFHFSSQIVMQILEHLGYPAEPQHERRRICREIFTLDRWTSMTAYGADQEPYLDQSIQRSQAIFSAEPRIAIPIIEYRGLCHTFQALILKHLQQMTTLCAHQEHYRHSDSTHCILRQIQHHLGIISALSMPLLAHQSITCPSFVEQTMPPEEPYRRGRGGEPSSPHHPPPPFDH